MLITLPFFISPRIDLETSDAHLLLSLPREIAIEGAHAYNIMKTQVLGFLKKLQEQGTKVVKESDIKDFFSEKKEELLARRRERNNL